MKKYNDYILENFNINNAELILEKSIFSHYKDIQHKVLKEYGSQLYFVATFNSAIVSLYPVVKQILYNSDFSIHLSTYQIVLLTIFAIAEILHVNNEAIKDIRRKLIKDRLHVHIEQVKKTLLSVEKIVKVISKTIGKTISLFIDMLAYVAILVPINEALIEILQQEGLDADTFYKKILGLGIGFGIITLKKIVIRILDKLGLHTSSGIEKKIEEVVEEEERKKENVYHKMRTKERMK